MHFDILHAILCGMFAPNSVSAARCAFLWMSKHRTKVKTPDLCPFFDLILLPDSSKEEDKTGKITVLPLLVS